MSPTGDNKLLRRNQIKNVSLLKIVGSETNKIRVSIAAWTWLTFLAWHSASRMAHLSLIGILRLPLCLPWRLSAPDKSIIGTLNQISPLPSIPIVTSQCFLSLSRPPSFLYPSIGPTPFVRSQRDYESYEFLTVAGCQTIR